MRFERVVWWMFAVLGVAAAGCGGDRRDTLLVVYSGDCQGYIEPCG